MTEQTKKIIVQFNELDELERLECLKFLQFNADPHQVIKRFAERHQKVHKSNIAFYCFPITSKNDQLTEAKMKTAYGKFTGVGKTSIEAKVHAVRNAESVEYQLLNSKVTYDPFGVLATLETNCDSIFSDELIS